MHSPDIIPIPSHSVLSTVSAAAPNTERTDEGIIAKTILPEKETISGKLHIWATLVLSVLLISYPTLVGVRLDDWIRGKLPLVAMTASLLALLTTIIQ